MTTKKRQTKTTRRTNSRATGRVLTGLDTLVADPSPLDGRRVGLVVNPTAVTADLEHAVHALRRTKAVRLTKLFGPEHGIWADQQDLVEVEDSRDPSTRLPVVSLYGPNRRPSAQMLKGVDTLVFDVQDVGSRYYTFIYTMLHCMEAAAEHGLRLVVLDRPNPLGGEALDGNVLREEFASFVGLHTIPVRHGMTVGELALMFHEERGLDCDLHVVRMTGWRRDMDFEETGLPWVLPSPNMPTVDTAYVYPGGCLVEGTNLSEGRGTTRPFELVGAPWIDPWRLARDLAKEQLPGVTFRATYFTPTFQKHAGRVCGGVQVHVTDRRRFPAFLAYLLLVHHARRQDPSQFAWRQPPYEYELVKLPFDILCGTDAIRLALEAGRSPRRLDAEWAQEQRAFARRRRPYLLY